MLGGHLAEFGPAGLGQADHLDAAVGGGRGGGARGPNPTSRSTSPVTLPFETIIRFETSDSVMPSGTLSSWAIRSKRGSVTSKRSRNRLRTSPSIKVVQVRSRSHSLSPSP